MNTNKRRYAYKGHFIRRCTSDGMWELILKPGFQFEGYGGTNGDGCHTGFLDTRAEARQEVNNALISECRCRVCTDPEAKVYYDKLLTGEQR